MSETMATSGDTATGTWTEWGVAPGFEIEGDSASIVMRQVDAQNFSVPSTFRFTDDAALTDIRDKLRRTDDDAVADELLEDARTFPAGAELTDLASVPRFLTWFENKYGRHTLAAIIHDRLILSGDPNRGALRSDVLADRFFRLMMRAAGVPFFKSWVMWAAVAMRTRWAARSGRRISLVVWGLMATTGIAMFVTWLGSALLDWGDPFGLSPGVRLALAVVMPFASAPLWGKQFGASFVAAVAALWILPPALLALVGYGIYLGLESAARAVGSND